MTAPVIFTWHGDTMTPLPRFDKICAKEFVIGALYKMDVIDVRSHVSHNHFFATVHDLWLNLPEEIAAHYPSADHLRKYALIQCGYRNERKIALATSREANEVAAFVRPLDDYAVIVVTDKIVTIYTAKTQSYRGMDKKEFQKSKQDVLEYLSSIIGVKAETAA